MYKKNTFAALPKPISSYKFKNVNFSIFLVKDLFNPKWENGKLLKILKRARASYNIYGNVPLLDEFDKKSLIYLIKAEYSEHSKKTKMEEWLSIRFTPGGGTPEITEDLLRIELNKKPLFDWVTNNTNKLQIENFISISRLCRISPKIQNSSFQKNIKQIKNKYTFISFVLANFEFLKHKHKFGPYKYVTGLFRKDLLEKKLIVKINGIYYPHFIEAHKHLKFDSLKVGVCRNDFTYSYPGYFLNLSDLKQLLEKMVDVRSIDIKTLRHYLKISKLERITDLDLNKHSKHLGKLLTVKNKIKHSKLLGKDLRVLLDKYVADGPKFMAMPIDNWKKDILFIFKKIPTII